MYDIAICNDALRDAEFLIRKIQRLGKYRDKIRFHEYGSGKELLSAMDEVRFSLIFMDVYMEEMDGEQVADEIVYIEKANKSVRVYITEVAAKNTKSNEIVRRDQGFGHRAG